MNSLWTNLTKASIVMISLPITFFASNYKALKAEESRGFYLTGSYGSSAITKADLKAKINLSIDNISSDVNHKGTLKFKNGSGLDTGLGYDFGRFRTELSYSQSNNEIKSIKAEIDEDVLGFPVKGTQAQASASGDLNISNIFINSYLDFPIGNKKKFTPYFGGGIGGSKLDIDDITVSGEEVKGASIWLFGYQWKLGLNYSISKNLNIFGEGVSSTFSDLGVAGDEYGLESSSDLSYRGGFRLYF